MKMNNEHIDKLTDETLNSMDGYSPVTPSPYLFTRIMSGLKNRKRNTIWDRLATIITRPSVAFAGMLLVIILNIFIISSLKQDVNYSAQDLQGEFTTATASSYEIENLLP